MAFLVKYKHLIFPAVVGIVGGSLIGWFASASPVVVGFLSGAALAVSFYRRPPMV